MSCARHLRLLVAGLLLTTAACDTAPERATGESDPAPRNQPAAAAPAAEVADKATIVDKTIAWPAADQLDEAARAGLSEQARAAVDQAPVPVLVVARPAWLEQAIVTRGTHFAAASANEDGVNVSLHASGRAHHYNHVKPAQGPANVRGQAVFVTQNEGIWSAAWIEGGVAYSLELECAALPDPRCDDDGYLMQLASGLAYVGGSGGPR